MLKSLGAFILIILGIGAGLTLYLPEEGISDNSVQVDYILIESTLKTPIDAEKLKLSSFLFDPKSPEEFQRGIEIGVYPTLKDAEIGLKSILKQYDLKHPAVPVIFKAQNPKLPKTQRQWYSIALGPIATEVESQKYEQSLSEQQLRFQPIVWLFSDKEANDEESISAK